MKIKAIIFFWLLICSTQVRSQYFFDDYSKAIQGKSAQEIETLTDSIIDTAIENKQFLKAAKISNSYSTSLFKNQKDYKTSIKYALIEINNYTKLNLFDENLSNALYNIGLSYYKIKDYEKSLESHLKNLDSKFKLKETYYEIGKNYYRLGDFFKAEAFYKKSINLLQIENDYNALIDNYFALVRVYNKLETKSSQTSLISVLVQLDKLKSKVNFSTWNQLLLYNYYAIYYRNLESYNFNKSKDYYLKTLELATSKNNSIFMCASCNNLGDLYNDVKNDSALIYLEKSLSFCKDKASLYYTYHQMGYAYLNINDLDNALKYIDKCINALSPENQNALSPSVENFKNITDKLNLILSFDRKAEIYIKKYGQDKNTDYIIKALEQLLLIDSFIDIIENDSSEEKSQLHWRENASVTYSKAIESARILNRPDLAFYFNEKSKALLLTESILKNDALTELPQSLFEKEVTLKKQILKLENELTETTKDSLFDLKIAYEKFTDSLQQEFPEYYNNKVKTQLLSLSEVKNKIDKNTVVISYNWNTAKNYNNVVYSNAIISGLAFTKDKNHFFSIKKSEELNQTIKTYRSLISQPLHTKKQKDDFETVAHQLFSTLFPEDLSKLIKNKKLIIIPDGDLQNLPFEALISNKDSKNYLIELNDISYAYSMSFLIHNQSIQRQTSKDFIGFAPISFSNQDLHTLKQTEQELISIKNIINGDIYTTTNATKANFLNTNIDSKIIHLATHANASGDPWIAFNDEKLKLHELYTFKNQADLAVLSACETAQGEIAIGEGVMSLARGFFYSGANSVVSSLWSVNDKSTSTIMASFYKNLKNGDTKSQALRRAKLDYIKTHSLSETSPYYWSSFILIGDSGMLPIKQNNTFLFVFISLALLLPIIYFISFKLKK